MKQSFKIFTLSVVWCHALYGSKIGLCIMATGPYLAYAERLIQSARLHFLTKHTVTYFVFTDGVLSDTGTDIVRIAQKRLGWPHDTLKRFHVYYSSKELLNTCEYLYATDADMLFVNAVGDEILGDLVGTLHPGYIGGPGTPETRTASKAFVPRNKRTRYFCGGFYGGKTGRVMALWCKLVHNVNDDESHGVMAIWHDESHLNHYFASHVPTLVLSPSYCYVYEYQLPYVPRLVALTKDHAVLRK